MLKYGRIHRCSFVINLRGREWEQWDASTYTYCTYTDGFTSLKLGNCRLVSLYVLLQGKNIRTHMYKPSNRTHEI